MAYKKYIKRDGKIYGPYVYHSRRVDGKVISEYRGPETTYKLSYRKIFIAILGVFILIALIYAIINHEKNLTGKAVINLDSDYSGGITNNQLILSLSEEVPESSRIVLKNNEEIILEKDISDFVYPYVFFNLLIEESISTEATETENPEIVSDNSSTTESEEKTTEAGETNIESMTEEIIETEETAGEVTEQQTTETEETPESLEESTGGFGFPLTGGVITNGENSVKVVEGKASKRESFSYILKEGEKFQGIDEESIKTEIRELGEDTLQVSENGNEIVVSTNYLEKEIRIDISSLNTEIKQGTLKISIIDNAGSEIDSLTINIGNTESAGSEDKETDLPEEIPEESNESVQDKEFFENVISIMNETLELTPEEKEILKKEFGNISIRTKSAVEKNGFITLTYEFGRYNVEFSYDSNLSQETLERFLKRDQIKWLKDIVLNLKKETIKEQEVIVFDNSYSF